MGINHSQDGVMGDKPCQNQDGVMGINHRQDGFLWISFTTAGSQLCPLGPGKLEFQEAQLEEAGS